MDDRAMQTLLKVASAKIDFLEAQVFQAHGEKERLRYLHQRLSLQRSELVNGADSDVPINAPSFRVRDLHRQKITALQSELQPSLARSAGELHEAQEALKSALRTKVALGLSMAALQRKPSASDAEDFDMMMLFEATKRR